MHFLLTDLFT